MGDMTHLLLSLSLSVSLMFIMNQSRKVEHSVSLWLTPPWWFWPKQATRSARWPVRSRCSTEPWTFNQQPPKKTFSKRGTGRYWLTKMKCRYVIMWWKKEAHSYSRLQMSWVCGPQAAADSKRGASLWILICGMGGGGGAGWGTKALSKSFCR